VEKFNRKKMIDELNRLAKENEELKRFIREDVTARGDVMRMYATMRIAVAESLGEEAVGKVIEKVRELTRIEETVFSNEAEQLFGRDMETHKIQ